jgi:hypothetical protein
VSLLAVCLVSNLVHFEEDEPRSSVGT